MIYKVEITPSAEKDIDDAVAWIIKKASFEAASRWLDGLIKRADGLAQMPTRFGFAPENRLFDKGVLRQFTYFSHRVIYHVGHARQKFLGKSDLGE